MAQITAFSHGLIESQCDSEHWVQPSPISSLSPVPMQSGDSLFPVMPRNSWLSGTWLVLLLVIYFLTAGARYFDQKNSSWLIETQPLTLPLTPYIWASQTLIYTQITASDSGGLGGA